MNAHVAYHTSNGHVPVPSVISETRSTYNLLSDMFGLSTYDYNYMPFDIVQVSIETPDHNPSTKVSGDFFREQYIVVIFEVRFDDDSDRVTKYLRQPELKKVIEECTEILHCDIEKVPLYVNTKYKSLVKMRLSNTLN